MPSTPPSPTLDASQSNPPPAPAPDLTDETQDFRFLASLTHQNLPSPSSSSTSPLPPQTLPRRGEKDFEPHGTAAQSSTLASSRAAMHDALAYTRSQPPKSALVGVLDGERGVTRVRQERGRGGWVRTMGGERGSGGKDKGGGEGGGAGAWELMPEEALYLVERGGLEVRWREGVGVGGDGGDDREGDGEDEGLPMSLQAAYAFLVGALGLTVERYLVYAGLKRSGYVVLRGPAWYEGDEERIWEVPLSSRRGVGIVEGEKGWKRWWSMLFGTKQPDQPPMGPLVGKGFYRSYADIYRLLSIIPTHDPTERTQPDNETAPATREVRDPPIRPCFYVWKPSTPFKKSTPPPPNFRVAVLDARESAFPTLEQLDGLLRSVPYDPPPTTMERQPMQRLKHGYRNVILAIVDQGVVSYMRVADAGFCKEKVYERATRGAGPKRGGGRGRGSRGRGRGR